MATRTIHDCDGCGKQNIPDPQRIFIDTGSHMDASGNGSESEGKDVDLCPTCLRWMIEELLKTVNDWDKNQSLINSLEERRSRLSRLRAGGQSVGV